MGCIVNGGMNEKYDLCNCILYICYCQDEPVAVVIFPARNSTRAFDGVAPPRPPPNKAVPPTTIVCLRMNQV